ncbi:MAG: F0F1 ATP synthase subunit A [Oscillospiraceae bacterium]|nr:F0F1 ATP synthase subunit A [Oscillospiraceae bacterium]
MGDSAINFDNRVLWTFELLGQEVWITQTIVSTWIIMGILLAFALAVRISMRWWKPIPTGFQNVVELIVDAFDGVVKSSAGESFMRLGNWFFMVFAFILTSSLTGIFGLRPPTADFATSFAFAMATFMLIQVYGLRYRKGKYLKSFFEPHFLFFPINLIGELARPVSLSFRLFGNVLAGMILMTLVYQLLPIWLQFVIPAALHAYFDLFSGVLQTYIFTVLSLTFIGQAGTATAGVPKKKRRRIRKSKV